jgi:hypothetical protein
VKPAISQKGLCRTRSWRGNRVYTVLFATNNEAVAIIMLLSVVMGVNSTIVYSGKLFVKHSFFADLFRRIGSGVLPLLDVLDLFFALYGSKKI